MAPHAEDTGPTLNGSGHRGPQLPADFITVASTNVQYTDEAIRSRYTYHTTSVQKSAKGTYQATPKETVYDFQIQRRVGRVGVMLVGWGGNNGSTVTAGIFANRLGLKWQTKNGEQAANYYGSVVMGSTTKLGTDGATGADVNVPFHRILPMLHPNDLEIGGWDISSMNLADAMDRAKVLEPTLKDKLRGKMSGMKPLRSIYYPDFIAANQEARADNVLPGQSACFAHIDQVRADIR